MDQAAMPRHQRSAGQAAVSLSLVDGRLRLDRLQQSGSAKAILPQLHRGVAEVVFLNTSGGLTGGDRLDYALTLGARANAVATTQTAERGYATTTGTARVTARFELGGGAHLDWLPQETILFDGAALDRRTEVDLVDDTASCLLLETVVLGRHAMGETIRHVGFSDRRIIRRAGRLVHLEPTMVETATLGPRSALLGPARAFASILALGGGQQDRLQPLRAVLDEPGVVAAATVIDDRLAVRLMAVDATPLRRQVLRALMVLRNGVPLPRVWQN